MRHLGQQIELGDAFLGSLADHDVWDVNFGYRRNPVSDSAIVKFAFGDYTEGADDRELTIWKTSSRAFRSLTTNSLGLEEELEENEAELLDEESLEEVSLEEESLEEQQGLASKFIDQLVKARRESRGSHKLRMTIICEDFAHHALFTQAQTDDRGVTRLVFDDIPNFGMMFLPTRYIADVTVRELQLWSNVPEPEIDLGRRSILNMTRIQTTTTMDISRRFHLLSTLISATSCNCISG